MLGKQRRKRPIDELAEEHRTVNECGLSGVFSDAVSGLDKYSLKAKAVLGGIIIVAVLGLWFGIIDPAFFS